MVVKVAKILIFLIVIAIVVFLSITVYKRPSEVAVPQGNMTLSPEDIIKPCNQSDINARTICKSVLLAGNGYIKEAKNFCESLEGDWKKRCNAPILAMQDMQDNAIELCKEIEYPIRRNSCILNVVASSPDEAMEFCLTIEDNDESNICVAQILKLQDNETKAFENCAKIENSTMKDLCVEILELMI